MSMRQQLQDLGYTSNEVTIMTPTIARYLIHKKIDPSSDQFSWKKLKELDAQGNLSIPVEISKTQTITTIETTEQLATDELHSNNADLSAENNTSPPIEQQTTASNSVNETRPDKPPKPSIQLEEIESFSTSSTSNNNNNNSKGKRKKKENTNHDEGIYIYTYIWWTRSQKEAFYNQCIL